MMEGHKVEKWVIALLWAGMLVSFPFNLFGGNGLYLSDIIGFSGLSLVSIIFYFKKSIGLPALLILLFVGTCNVATFTTLFNTQVTYSSLGRQLTPGMQLYSLVFFGALAVLRRPVILEGFQRIFGVSEQDREAEFENKIVYFKERFEPLDTDELKRKLNAGLSEEAVSALLLILEERKAQ